jgi:hypothetical protein
MPVQKFRSFEDARRALWMDRSDRGLLRRARALLVFCRRLAGDFPFPSGVRKFRSIEEANAERAHWEEQRMKALRARVQPHTR